MRGNKNREMTFVSFGELRERRNFFGSSRKIKERNEMRGCCMEVTGVLETIKYKHI